MDPKIPWYQSAIVRQQLVQIIAAGTALFGVNLGDFDVDATLVSIFAGIAGLVGVWTLVTRLFKPNPNLTETAANKERQLVRDGVLPSVHVSNGRQQGGFFRPALVLWIALFAAGVSVAVLPGCAGTRDAYSSARATDNAVADTAYVVAEHYAAVVHEAANLAQLATTPDDVKDAMKAADRAVKPLILGDPNTGQPGLRVLAERYAAVRTAATQAELQAAINAAVLELSKLINAVKAARRPS
jgi:hypothetical protein